MNPAEPGQTMRFRFHVQARRVDAHGGLAVCKQAELLLDTDPTGQMRRKTPAA